MAEKKSRAAARKIKDKWKAKVWYNLLAPEMFNKQLLGETPTDTPDKLVGRVTEVTVQDLTGDFSKMHIKLQFRVNAVQGQDALTQFVGHDMTSDYIRRLTRRKRTRTDLTVDVVTKDGWNVRVKPMAITDRRIQTSKQRVIRTIMAKLVRMTRCFEDRKSTRLNSSHANISYAVFCLKKKKKNENYKNKTKV